MGEYQWGLALAAQPETGDVITLARGACAEVSALKVCAGVGTSGGRTQSRDRGVALGGDDKV